MARPMDVLLCRWIRPHHFIVLMGMASFLAFVAAYVISVASGHVEALFPYISEMGTRPPESCIFGFFLSVSSFLAFVCMFIRHENYANQIFIESQSSHVLNDVGLFFGFLSALGMCIVASFQETNQLNMHIVGSSLVFGCGIIYCWIHSYLSYRSIAFMMNSRFTVWLRFLLSFFVTCSFILTYTGLSVAGSQWRHGNHSNDTQIKWKDSDPGYDWHLTSTFSELLMAIFLICYFFTFYCEFSQIRLTVKVRRPFNLDSPRSEMLPEEGIVT